MWKTEVAIKMYFTKQLLFTISFESKKKILVVLGKCLKDFPEQVHF